ncbi:MAG: DUF4340 domain-containing protein [Candidatus Sumerlaeia bacterium]|nr:DUF4340 domain-containing protein [Candidatus Sumerlaeia bacterium]
MNQKALITLGAVAAVIAILAGIVTMTSSDRAVDTSPGNYVAPGLLENLNDAEKVVVRTGNDTVTLTRDGDTWRVEERHGYPARLDNVRTLLMEVANLRQLEPRTSNPDLYHRIEVEDIDAPDSASRLVEIHGPGGTKLASVIVGSTRFGQGPGARQTTFVRNSDQAQSWLADGPVNVNTSTSHWVDTQFLSIRSNDVQRVEVTHADGEVVIINKPDPNQSNFDLETLPEDRELTSPTRPNELGGLMASLRFDEVKPTSEFDLDTTPTVTVTLDEKNGHRVVARAWDADGQKWFQFSSTVDEDRINAINEARLAEVEEVSEGDAAPSVPDLIDVSTVQEKSTRLAKVFDGWIYKLPNFSRDRFLRRNEYYLKSLEPEYPDDVPDEEEWLTEPIVEPGNIHLDPGTDLDAESMERLQRAVDELMREDPTGELPGDVLEVLGEEELPQVPEDAGEFDLLPEN